MANAVVSERDLATAAVTNEHYHRCACPSCIRVAKAIANAREEENRACQAIASHFVVFLLNGHPRMDAAHAIAARIAARRASATEGEV